MSLISDHAIASKRKPRATTPVSLSSYFPKGTQYFYGYPAGEDSGFLNQVSPDVEELVAARAISCAGAHVSVVGFAATNAPLLDDALLKEFAIPQLSKRQLTLLPQEIDASITGNERNRVIKDSLLRKIGTGRLVMAQPYMGEDIETIYQIPAKLSGWLNDKSTMEHYIAPHYLPERLATYANGAALKDSYTELELPYVIKASSSSAGDGVFMCHTISDVEAAVDSLSTVAGTILVEQHIETAQNFGLHFGIPSDSSKPIDILGVNEQLTTPQGEFLGGIIRSTTYPTELLGVIEYLQTELLPKIREMGWYGVGCFDVLRDSQGKLFFIDCNFRMTGMSAYHFLVANRTVRSPLISFGGKFTGSRASFRRHMRALAGADSPRKMMQLIALSHHGGTWDFNAALFFDTDEQLAQRIKTLLDLGVESQALEQLRQQFV